ncbi:hypothetical protein KBC03_06120 [Patescibacteria group bacterium]|nr:hypothetical protein [Patescibacteria group bacterium]
MAVNVQKHEDGYLLEGKFYICFSKPHKTHINLMTMKGTDMTYSNGDEKNMPFVIDYPGEYDKDEVTIKVVEDKGGALNYLLKYNNQIVAFVQSASAFDDEDFTAAKYRLYVDPFIAKTIDKMELEGEKIDLTTIAE